MFPDPLHMIQESEAPNKNHNPHVPEFPILQLLPKEPSSPTRHVPYHCCPELSFGTWSHLCILLFLTGS